MASRLFIGPPRLCAQCGQFLTHQQMMRVRRGNPQRFCSVACKNRGYALIGQGKRESVRLPEVLGILRFNEGWWMTLSDLALWVYGDDDFYGRVAIKKVIYELRKAGHVIISCRARWASYGQQWVTGYRLIEDVQSQEAIA